MFLARLSVCLILLTTCSARPSWHKDSFHEDNLKEPVEERVNLHHTLKDLQYSATKAVKDMHKYIHQQLNSVAKTSVEKIGKPLATVVLGPAILMKETLDALAGKRRPPPEEDVSSWCPTCLEDDTFDLRPQENTAKPCYEPNCHNGYEHNHNTADNNWSSPQTPFDQETSASKDTSQGKPFESETATVYPAESETESKLSEADIDIRFGNDST